MSLVIEMVSDVVCPWCWLGLRRLKSALAFVPHIEPEIWFRPYELDPNIPPEGVDYKAYMTAKFGGTGESGEDPQRNRFRAMRNALEEYGRNEDIPYDFAGITHRPNTFDAHRLIRWAQGQGLGMDAKERLFRAYFTEHLDIGDHDVLTRLSGEIGLDPAIVGKLLASDADMDTVRQEEQVFQQMGVRGVPTYIANRRYAAQGAETAEKLAKFLTTVAEADPAGVGPS